VKINVREFIRKWRCRVSKIICHKNERYNIYCTVSDGFYFESSLNIDQLKYFIKEEYGDDGINNLSGRLDRAHKTGTSSIHGDDLESLLCCNRAGLDEKKLSIEQCVNNFLSKKVEV